MQVVFRTDASTAIGSGHVMRCLCLAQELREQSATCSFICRDLAGNLTARIRAVGFDCHILPIAAPTTQSNSDAISHAHWLPVSQDTDARETRVILDRTAPDWLVKDHYALDARWDDAVNRPGMRRLVIDDLADRSHACELLLDQTLGRRSQEYADQVPVGCLQLLGPRYALLRPEFRQWRDRALKQQRNWRPRHILVAMGGVDQPNATAQVLRDLEKRTAHPDQRITVVLGTAAPHVDTVRALARASSRHIDVLTDVSNMAELMTSADIAIGAPGTTAWERCALGLPSLMLTIANNQKDNAFALDDAGAAISIGAIEDPDWPDQLHNAFRKLADPDRFAAMVEVAFSTVDAIGAARVAREMATPALNLRRCTNDDTHTVWEWREAGNAARFYRSGKATSWEDHAAWFAKALSDPHRILVMAECDGRAVAHVRFDLAKSAPETASVGICVDPDARGKGLSYHALMAALAEARRRGITQVVADIHQDNRASLRLFAAAAFMAQAKDKEFCQVSRFLAASDKAMTSPAMT